MSQRLWVLLEWVTENYAFPAYCVVNIVKLSYIRTEISPGKEISVRLKNGTSKRAIVLRISGSKLYLVEYQQLLERQDIKVLEPLNAPPREQQPGDRDVDGPSENNSTSDSDAEMQHMFNRRRVLPSVSPRVKYIAENGHRPSGNNSFHERRRALPVNHEAPRKTYATKSTQTEFPLELDVRIQELEDVLVTLYRKFEEAVLISNPHLMYEQNIPGLNIPPRTPQPGPSGLNGNDPNGLCQPSTSRAGMPPRPRLYIPQPAPVDEPMAEPQNNPGMQVDTERPATSGNCVVRRMSAHTTNNLDSDLVQIGFGNTRVSARVLNKIDWRSHTTATRQLLQAVFSRKILATHTLTGKQSPAFANKPAKKILDPSLVEDVVSTVSQRCNVPQNLVRSVITNKCQDESRLYRSRRGRQNQGPNENNDHSTSSDGSDN